MVKKQSIFWSLAIAGVLVANTVNAANLRQPESLSPSESALVCSDSTDGHTLRQAIINTDSYGNISAAFDKLTEKQKCLVWIDKLDEVLSLDWTQDEHNHIKALKDAMSRPDFFSADENKNNESKQFANEWAQEGIKKFGWTNEIVYAIAGTLENMTSVKGDVDIINPNEK